MTTSVETIPGEFFASRAAIPHPREATDPHVIAMSSFVAPTFRADIETFPASGRDFRDQGFCD
jgi:hypothetical protein